MSTTYEGRALAAKGDGAEVLRELLHREVERVIDETAEEEWATDHGVKYLNKLWLAYLDIHGTDGPLRKAFQGFINRAGKAFNKKSNGWVVVFGSGAPIHRDMNARSARPARRPDEVRVFDSPTEALQFMMSYARRLGAADPNSGAAPFHYQLMQYSELEGLG